MRCTFDALRGDENMTAMLHSRDMLRKCLFASISVVALAAATPAAFAAGAGILDKTFGADGNTDGTPDGVVSTSLGSGDDVANAVARAPNGEIVIAGSHFAKGSSDIIVARYTHAGKLDKTFGADGNSDGTPDGVVDVSLGDGDDVATSVVVQPDSKVVVAGYHLDGKSKNIFVARFNENGSLDKGFGADGNADGAPDGVVNVSLGDGDDVARAVALQPDGKIVVAGDTVKGSSSNILVARFNKDGTLDKAFGADAGSDGTPDGFVSLDLGAGDDLANGLAIDGDGKIIVAGSHKDNGSNNIIVARFSKDGTLDKGFGADGNSDGTPDGVVSQSLGAGDDVARAVALDEKGRIVIAGTNTSTGGSSNILLARFLRDGKLDAAFGADGGSDGTPDGFVSLDLGKGDDAAASMGIQPDGKIVVAGYHTDGGSKNIVVARYLDNGNLDAAFGADGNSDGTPDGVFGISLGAGDDVANGLLIDGSKLIVVAGSTEDKDKSKNIVLLRLLAE
ncbi:putative delta-60 repeat protein [Angulomicrobium tetraedrale]|uniref:Putative delta-60 repeat protein n=1 Tax=Ancylobacter tetraedralis TaxID=217068 RepID=A0A839ZBB1_9HYPH|nr:putative delta-60 repeat protein [Ancylobacter tetraedralis]